MFTHGMLHRIAPALFTSRRGLPCELPGPPPGKFLSTGGPLLPWAGDSLGHASRLFDEFGPVVALVQGGGTRHISKDRDCPGTVLCWGADLNQQITKEHETYTKGYLSGSLYPGEKPTERKRPLLSFGAGLFSVNGDDHRRHRRLLTPAFSRQRLQNYCREMYRLTEEELDGWTLNESRNISDDMRHLTAKIVSQTLFGSTDPQATEKASYHLERALQLMGKPTTRLFTFDFPGFPYRAYLDAATRLEEHVQGLIQKRKDEGGEGDDMLSALVSAHDDQSNSRLSDSEILGHISVFFAAGHETTAHALTWTLFLLAQFPQVTNRVLAEIDTLASEGAFDLNDLDQLEYLGWVIKESLRLFPPAPWNGRILGRDVILGGHSIPAGTEILFSIYETQRRDPVYRKPQEFSPERWEGLKPSPYQYSPFSAGPRTCIGAQFALMEMKVVLATLLRRYRLALTQSEVNRFAELVLSPQEGMTMRVHPQDGASEASTAKVRGNIHDMVQLPKDL
ncbi:MAG: cytochrome P450 [Polyangiaceae bacterium]|nr:cytochrome P450 [Polyangiaceae bacterium]